MTHTHILFDLDGTLSDPMTGICTAVQYALRRFGIEVSDISTLIPFIGPPLRQSFTERYGFTPEQAEEALRAYDEYYIGRRGMYQCTMYAGIDTLLTRLCHAGKRLCLATSKPEPLARDILRHFGIERHFHFIGGDTPQHTRSAKADVVQYVLRATGITDPSQAIMVGDRKFDVIGAHTHGLAAIGVLYGYGDRAELTAAGADYIAEDLPALEALLLG